MAIEIVDFPIKNGGSFHSYVSHYQRVSIKVRNSIAAIAYSYFTFLVRSLDFCWGPPLIETPNQYPPVRLASKSMGFPVREAI